MTSAIFTTIDWQGITLSVTYQPNPFGSRRSPANAVAHLEVQAVAPEGAALPIAETGYSSLHLSLVYVEEAGEPVPYVLAWLDAAAQSPKWRKRQDAARQLSLF